jgi:RNA-directed DNA polymerase
VAEAIVHNKTRVIDLDLASFFDSMRHDLVLAKVARRVQDRAILHLLKMILKASGKRGVVQDGPLSPLLANVYLTEVDAMLERAKEVSREGPYTYVEYVRWADDLVILVDGYRRHDWLLRGVHRRLREELTKLDLRLNEQKTRIVDLTQGESFGFLGFDFRRLRSRRGVWWPQYAPKLKTRTALLRKLKEIFRRFISRPVDRVIQLINPIVRGWVNYFRIGHASRCFGYVKDWVEKKVRRTCEGSAGRGGVGRGSTTGSACFETTESSEPHMPESAPGTIGRITLEVKLAPGTIGRITLEVKLAGERCAGKPHAPFDEAGAGTRARSRDRSACNEVRGQRRTYSATAPALDPTDERGLETEHGLGTAAPAA